MQLISISKNCFCRFVPDVYLDLETNPLGAEPRPFFQEHFLVLLFDVLYILVLSYLVQILNTESVICKSPRKHQVGDAWLDCAVTV